MKNLMLAIDFDNVIAEATKLATTYVPKVIGAILVLIIGMKIIKSITKLVERVCDKRGMDSTVGSFVASLLGWILKAVLVIAVLSMIGVETTSFVAIIGAAGLAVGLALQGTLANFAGGVLAMIFKPFVEGDLVESQGVVGVVKEIQIFNTIMLTPENKTAIMPNGALMNSHIINYTREGKIRVDLTIGIDYSADIRKAKEIMLGVMNSNSQVLKDPAPSVAVSELGDSSVNMAVRPWCDPADYWDVYFGTLEDCKNALDDAGIGIPFPQMDVHIQQQ